MTSHGSDGSSIKSARHRLLATVKQLVANEREATARLLAHLAVMDSRQLYLGQGCSSLFTYCTQVLHLSEHAAYARIEVARAARKFPAVLEALASGALHLTAINLIAPHLRAENVDRVIAEATHRTKRGLEELVATLHSQSPVPSSVRKLPQATRRASRDKPAGSQPESLLDTCEAVYPPVVDAVSEASAGGEVRVSAQPVPRAAIRPLAPEQYLVKFTASRAMQENLREAQALARIRVGMSSIRA